MPTINSSSFENCFKLSFEQRNLSKNRGDRKIVKGLSKGSRRRLISLINSLGHQGDSFFVTLTVREASEDFKQWKKWLNITLTRLRKDFPQLSGIWRLEFQERGTPHFHFLIIPNSLVDLKILRTKLQAYWSNAVGVSNTGSMGHKGKPNTVQRVRDMRKCGFYLSIYQAKNEQDRKDIPTGRTWGIINKKGLPIAQYASETELPIEYLVWAKRIYRRWIKSKGAYAKSPLMFSLKSRSSGFTGFMPRSLQRRFFALCSDLSKQPEPLKKVA